MGLIVGRLSRAVSATAKAATRRLGRAVLRPLPLNRREQDRAEVEEGLANWAGRLQRGLARAGGQFEFADVHLPEVVPRARAGHLAAEFAPVNLEHKLI